MKSSPQTTIGEWRAVPRTYGVYLALCTLVASPGTPTTRATKLERQKAANFKM